jgi:hypothetical protein
MYILHNTDSSNIKSILKDGYLKSLDVLKKDKKNVSPNEGDGLYTKNNFVYFTCTDKLFDKKTCGNIVLYFDSKVLLKKTFYVSTFHSYEPQLNLYISKSNYKRKYEKNYTRYNYVLKKLYKNSISKLKNGKVFQIFQQIAIRTKINLDELVAIDFIRFNKSDDKIIKYISKYYPHIIVNKRCIKKLK